MSYPEHQHAAFYSPTRLSALQALLAALADLDCALEVDLETVETSAIPGALKEGIISNLHQRHQERRAPYVRQLETLHGGRPP